MRPISKEKEGDREREVEVGSEMRDEEVIEGVEDVDAEE
jgi:hypothetical protein